MRFISLALIGLLLLFVLGCVKQQSPATTPEQFAPVEPPDSPSDQESTALDEDLRELEDDEMDDLEVADEDFVI